VDGTGGQYLWDLGKIRWIYVRMGIGTDVGLSVFEDMKLRIKVEWYCIRDEQLQRADCCLRNNIQY
jgi:hypothetical protein